ncbi:putative uncharacterized protein [Segatella copri CAG:164]|nr:putative uncharacterized protein [Segatella copri CAG:164]
MLHMVLDDTKLQELYDYDQSEYEDLYTALNSDNVVVASVARIIKELDGSTDESVQKKVYKTIFSYINDNLLI